MVATLAVTLAVAGTGLAQNANSLDQVMAGYSSWWLSTQRSFHGWTGFKFIKQEWAHDPKRGLVLECIGVGARQQLGAAAGEMGHISLRFYRDPKTGNWSHEPTDPQTNAELLLGVISAADIRRFFPDSPVSGMNPATSSISTPVSPAPAQPAHTPSQPSGKALRLKSGTYQADAGGAVLKWELQVSPSGAISGTCNETEALTGTFSGTTIQIRRACPGFSPDYQNFEGNLVGNLIQGTFTGAGVTPGTKAEWALRLEP
jgi:hypothetical protein